MERINNTSQLSAGDVILTIPKTLLLNVKTPIVLDGSNKCFRINPQDCDVESFTEEIGIGIVTLYDTLEHKLFIENIYTGNGMWIPDNIPLHSERKNYWKN